MRNYTETHKSRFFIKLGKTLANTLKAFKNYSKHPCCVATILQIFRGFSLFYPLCRIKMGNNYLVSAPSVVSRFEREGGDVSSSGRAYLSRDIDEKFPSKQGPHPKRCFLGEAGLGGTPNRRD